jgi:methionine synthase / methylenetetrahydrofolate reductase (NADH)
MPADFLTALNERILVCDGAMGTMLYAKGVLVPKGFDALNLQRPDLVSDVHIEYVRAGADVVETNTFGANRVKLGAVGLADAVEAVNREGVHLARAAAGDAVYVAGAIGPLGIRIEPWGKTGVDEARAHFREQAAALLAGGVDLFVLETFRDANEIGAAIDAVRSLTDLPIVAQMTTEEDGNTLDGTPPERFAPELARHGATVLGVNCAVGPASMLETIERLEAVTDRPLSAQPNAGKPREVEGRNLYLCSPEYMASYARRFIQHHVRLIGGCCGTTPEHIRQIKAAVRSPGPSLTSREPVGVVTEARATGVSTAASLASVAASEAVQPVARAAKSTFAAALAAGRFVRMVELVPPRGFNVDDVIARARRLHALGVDVVNIPDAVRAGARLSALALAVLIEQHAGLETVLHYACRDRNLLGIQSDLLGAHAMGVRNLMLVTGDPGRVGDYPDATAVFDVDSIGLTNLVARLNHGADVGGQAIGRPTAFHIGVSINPTAPKLDEELRRFDYKVEAGAEFVLTRPVFDVAVFERVLRRIESSRLPVVAGVLPFESARHAEFLANEEPGVRVPEALLERMRRVDDDGHVEGLAIAREIAQQLRPLVQGLQVSTPSDVVDAASVIL